MIKTGDYVKLLVGGTPYKSINQGLAPKFMKVVVNKVNYMLPYNALFKVSSKCDPINKIANLETKPYAQIHIDFVKNNETFFQKIKE